MITSPMSLILQFTTFKIKKKILKSGVEPIPDHVKGNMGRDKSKTKPKLQKTLNKTAK